MSHGVEVVMKSDITNADVLCQELGKVLHLRFTEDDLGTHKVYRALALGLDITLLDTEGLVDDRELLFTRYTHYLSIYSTRPTKKEEIWLEYMRSTAIFLASVLYERLGYETMAVDDMQRCLSVNPSTGSND